MQGIQVIGGHRQPSSAHLPRLFVILGKLKLSESSSFVLARANCRLASAVLKGGLSFEYSPGILVLRRVWLPVLMQHVLGQDLSSRQLKAQLSDLRMHVLDWSSSQPLVRLLLDCMNEKNLHLKVQIL